MITTTLNRLWEKNPCKSGWDKGLKYLGKTTPDDEPLSLLTILENNGLEDTIWALRATKGYEREIKLFACVCACHALKYYEKEYKNNAPRIAIEMAALYIEGEVTRDDADAALAVADAALAAALAAADAALAAALAALAADAADALAADAALDAADAALDALAADAALDADAADALAAEREFQRQELILMITQGHEYMKI